LTLQPFAERTIVLENETILPACRFQDTSTSFSEISKKADENNAAKIILATLFTPVIFCYQKGNENVGRGVVKQR